MRIVVLRNSIAGRGKGRGTVDRLIGCLTDSGHQVVAFDVDRGVARDEKLVRALQTAGAFIIAGGDGTIHHAASVAIEADVPIIHFPMGTENLFAREFRHLPSPSAVLSAIQQNRPGRVDVGLCDGRPFLLMASIGFDSCIVERIAAARIGGISRLTYLRHGAAEFLRPRFVPVTVRVDGRELVSGRAGMVIVANSRQYAARLDPARDASMRDGLLDVVFISVGSRSALVRRALQVIRGTHIHDAGVISARGTAATVVAHCRMPLQLDGEHARVLAAGQEVKFGVLPSGLAVLAS